MSGLPLPPKPDFDSRNDDRRSPPRRPERSDNDRKASSSRGPPPLADSYIAPVGDTYIPRHDDRSRRPSPPPRSWREPLRRSPPPRRRDELTDRRRDYPPRSRDYPRGGPRDRDWRRDRDYDGRDRHHPRRSPSPHNRDRRWTSRGSPSPHRRSGTWRSEVPLSATLTVAHTPQRTTTEDVRRHTILGVQYPLPVTGGCLREGGKTGDSLPDVHLHGTAIGREDRLIVAAVAVVKLGVLPPAYLLLKPKLLVPDRPQKFLLPLIG